MKARNIFWGLAFLAAAVLIIGNQLGLGVIGEIKSFTLLATLLLAAVIVSSIAHRNIFGFLIPLAFLYNLYQRPLQLPAMNLWQLLLAAVLMGIGFSILFRNRPPKKWFTAAEGPDGDNNPVAKVSFGASAKYLHGDCIRKGQFSVSFGAMEIYFDQAQLSPEGADIYLQCSFGSIELYVPKEWQVIDNIRTTLGNVEINQKKFPLPDPDAPRLTLHGNVELGSIEINHI